MLERGDVLSPYVELDRETGPRLRADHPMSLTADDVARLRGLGDPLDMKEVEEVYLPLSRLLQLLRRGDQQPARRHQRVPRRAAAADPFVIGVAGSVAVGKSTTSRILRELLSRWPDTPRVELVTTDGFLFPNAELERRDIMAAQGVPRVLRPPGADAVRRRDEVRASPRSRRRSTRTSPTTS